MKTITLKYHLGIFFILDNYAVFRLMMAAHCKNTCSNAEGIFLVFQFKDSLVSVASQVTTAHSHLCLVLAKRFFSGFEMALAPKRMYEEKE